jgi:hypothetical protein
MAEPSPSKLARNNQPSYCGGLPNVWPLLATQAKDMILARSIQLGLAQGRLLEGWRAQA